MVHHPTSKLRTWREAREEGEGGEDAEKDKEEQEEKVEGGGRWVHKLTGDSLGGPEGYLEFTVIG